MIVPPEVFLDALAFADFQGRLRMLVVSRRLNAIVDANRNRLHLPKVWQSRLFYEAPKEVAVGVTGALCCVASCLLILVSAHTISAGIAVSNVLGEIFVALAMLAAPCVFLAFPTWEGTKAHSSLMDNLRRSTNEELRKSLEKKLTIISVLFMIQVIVILVESALLIYYMLVRPEGSCRVLINSAVAIRVYGSVAERVAKWCAPPANGN